MTAGEAEGPVRLCCGQRHVGPVCPDGRVMCCICFSRFEQHELYTDADGVWDICRSCGLREEEARAARIEREIAWLNQQMNSAERDTEADAPGVWDAGGWVDYARSLLQFSPHISEEAKREFCRMQGLGFREEYR